MFCHQCGTEAREGAVFCGTCGAKLITAGTEEQAPVKSAVAPEPIPVEITTPPPAEPISEPTPPFAQPISAPAAPPVEPTPEPETAQQPAASGPMLLREACERLEASAGDCPRIKKVALTKRSSIKITGFFNTYTYASTALYADISWSARWMFWPFVLLYCVCGVVFLEFFFEQKYYPALAICDLICCVGWYIFIFLSGRERKEITAHVKKTLNCRMKPPSKAAKVYMILIAVWNFIEIGLCVAALVLSLDGIMDSFVDRFGDSREPVYTVSGSRDVSNSMEVTASEGISLTRTYTDKEEGFSFKYPRDWTVEDAEAVDPNLLVYVTYSGGLGIYASINVTKEENDGSYFAATEVDFKEGYSSLDNINDMEVTDLTDVTLDGQPARKVTFTATNDAATRVVLIQYFYIRGSDVYIVTCSAVETGFDRYEPILDAIMDSYTITAGKNNVDPDAASARFPLKGSTEARKVFDEWVAEHPLEFDYYMELDTDDWTDDDGGSAFLFDVYGDDHALLFMISVRKSDGYMQFVYSRGGSMDLDEWYEEWHREDTSYDLYFNGVSLTEWCGGPPDILYDYLGWPDYGTFLDGSLYEGGEYFGYEDGVIFIIDDQTDRIGWITGAAEAVEVNGVTLDQTRGRLIDLLGMPADEGGGYDEMTEASYYVMRYYINGAVVDITMDNIYSKAETFLIYY